jgi:CRISPR system Cascade subunit CasE
MYLTKLELDLTNPGMRAALRDAQKLHQLVTGLFQCARKDAEILYRCRGRGIHTDLYMYSACPVDPNRILPGMRLVAQRDVTPWLESMEVGDVFSFQLVTAPFRKVAEDGTRNSRRRALRTQEERLAWLSRKAEQGGFRLLSTEEAPAEKLIARHSAGSGGSLTVDAHCYSGFLRVEDAEHFRQTVACGIGPEKAYGLGMLLLKRG